MIIKCLNVTQMAFQNLEVLARYIVDDVISEALKLVRNSVASPTYGHLVVRDKHCSCVAPRNRNLTSRDIVGSPLTISRDLKRGSMLASQSRDIPSRDILVQSMQLPGRLNVSYDSVNTSTDNLMTSFEDSAVTSHDSAIYENFSHTSDTNIYGSLVVLDELRS